MPLRFLGGLLILFIAFALQFFLAGAGIFFNLAFAALIALAFLFDLWEMLLFAAIAVFIVNWKPAASGELLVFAAYPVAVFFCRNLLTWQTWAKDLAAIALGFVLLYGAALHGLPAARIPALVIDLLVGELFGLAVILPLYHSRRS